MSSPSARTECKRILGDRLEVTLEYGPGRQVDRFDWHIYSLQEITEIGERRGVALITACSGFDTSKPPSDDNPRMQLVFAETKGTPKQHNEPFRTHCWLDWIALLRYVMHEPCYTHRRCDSPEGARIGGRITESASRTHRTTRRWLAWVIALLLPALSGSLSVQAAAPWPTLTARDGLAATPALALAALPNGALWIGGMGGVTRWDGQSAAVWTKADGLGDSWVTSLAIADGTVWAGMPDGGLGRFSPTAPGQPWRTLTITDGLPSRHVTSLAAAPDGTLWVGTYGGGLGRVRGDRVERVKGAASVWITALATTDDNDLWVGTSGEGVSRHTGANWTTYTSELPDQNVRALAADRRGHVYVGTSSGLAVWERSGWRTFGVADGLPDRRILSLAVDAQGAVWAGTAGGLAYRDGNRWRAVDGGTLPSSYIAALAPLPGGGLAVGTPGGVSLSNATVRPEPPRLLPVLFVHGWRGAPFTSIYNSEARFLKWWLDQRGQPLVYVQGIDSNDTLFNNAARLRDAIAQMRKDTGAPKVHLIGHSMGGLTSRAYLESALYAGDVASLTTLGSPHSGAVQWRDYLIREISRGSVEPSARELLPDHMTLFNTLGQKPPDVPYYLLGGDITEREGLTWLDFWPPTDGIVSLWSALSLDGSGITKIETQDLHGWATGSVAFGVPSYLWPIDNYRSFLRPILSGRQPPSANPPRRDFGRPIVRPDAPPRTPYITGTLRPGQTVTHRVALDGGGAARILALWERGDVRVTLTSPNGSVFRQASGETVDYFGFNLDTFANLAVYKVSRRQGTWTVALQGPTDGRDTDYVVYAELDSPITLIAASDSPLYRPGASVHLTAALPLTAAPATVTAELYAGGSVATKVTLLDDGAHGDGRASDGVYGGTVLAPNAPDYYPVIVIARGRDDSYERARGLVLVVAAPRARLASPLTTTDGPDGVVATIPVDVAAAGSYAVAVRAAQPGGSLTRTVLPVTLAAGSQTVTVPLRGVPAGTRLSEVILLDNTTALIPIDQRSLP